MRLHQNISLYKDGEWTLTKDGNDRPDPTLEYWLYHRCPEQAHVFRYRNDAHTPCEWCGSVCPPGLQGMYLMLAVL